MKRIWRKEILIETETICFIKVGSKENTPTCKICSDKTKMISPILLAEILQISSREIYKKVEENKIHYFENDSFEFFVCPNSLKNLFNQEVKLLH